METLKTNSIGYTYYSTLGKFLENSLNAESSIDKNNNWGVSEIFSQETLEEIHLESAEQFLRSINSILSETYSDSTAFQMALKDHWDKSVAIKLDSYLMAKETNLKPEHEDLYRKKKVKRIKAWFFIFVFVGISPASVWLNHQFLGIYTKIFREENTLNFSSLLFALPAYLFILLSWLISTRFKTISKRIKTIFILLSFPVLFYPCLYLASLVYNVSPSVPDSWIVSIFLLCGWVVPCVFSFLFSYAWLIVFLYYILDEYAKELLRRRFGYFA